MTWDRHLYDTCGKARLAAPESTFFSRQLAYYNLSIQHYGALKFSNYADAFRCNLKDLTMTTALKFENIQPGMKLEYHRLKGTTNEREWVPVTVESMTYGGTENHLKVIREDRCTHVLLGSELSRLRLPQPPKPKPKFAIDERVEFTLGSFRYRGRIRAVENTAGPTYTVLTDGGTHRSVLERDLRAEDTFARDCAAALKNAIDEATKSLKDDVAKLKTDLQNVIKKNIELRQKIDAAKAAL